MLSAPRLRRGVLHRAALKTPRKARTTLAEDWAHCSVTLAISSRSADITTNLCMKSRSGHERLICFVRAATGTDNRNEPILHQTTERGIAVMTLCPKCGHVLGRKKFNLRPSTDRWVESGTLCCWNERCPLYLVDVEPEKGAGWNLGGDPTPQPKEEK